MSLLTITRALDDRDFGWRVTGACIIKAATFASMTEADGKFYAIHTIMHPQSLDMSMAALVAMDSVIAAAITVTPEGTVDTSAVTDADIQRVVDEKWSLVGNKYQTNPLT